MNSGFDFDELKRELDSLRSTRAQEQCNVEVEMQKLNRIHESVKMIQEENRLLQSLINTNLRQVMEVAESNTAAQILKSLSQIEIEIAKLDMARGEQREATENLDKELQETLHVLASLRNGDECIVEKKIEELEKIAFERKVEVQRLKDEKEVLRQDMARFRKESRQEMEDLLAHYNELHAKMMYKKYAPAEYPEDIADE